MGRNCGRRADWRRMDFLIITISSCTLLTSTHSLGRPNPTFPTGPLILEFCHVLAIRATTEGRQGAPLLEHCRKSALCGRSCGAASGFSGPRFPPLEAFGRRPKARSSRPAVARRAPSSPAPSWRASPLATRTASGIAIGASSRTSASRADGSCRGMCCIWARSTTRRNWRGAIRLRCWTRRRIGRRPKSPLPPPPPPTPCSADLRGMVAVVSTT